jgi:hypothetical protein
MNAADIVTQLVALERAVGRRDSSAIRSRQLRVEEEVFDLERPPIETLRESPLSRWRLENCEPRSMMAWSRMPGRRVSERRANAS